MIQWVIHITLYNWLGLNPSSKLIIAVDFFFYDTIKILILLYLVSMFMNFVNTYLPIEKIRDFLNNKNLFGLQYFFASFFGAVTPFCSCSSVPLFIGFVKGGIPLGVTFAFLVTSPLVNEIAVAMFLGIFGFKVTTIYVISGIFLGMVAGVLLGKLNQEKYLADWVKEMLKNSTARREIPISDNMTFGERITNASRESFMIVKGIIWYVLIGIGVGAAIHGYVPDYFFVQYISKNNLLAVPLAVISGIPLYSNAAGVIPIMQVLVSKDVPIGTALAFMMAVVGISLPEAMLLKKIMQMRLLVTFFSVVGFCIILLGYFFNFIL
ncbi:MAG: permease [Leptospiraceae bacterium]|nr:permease [Leptospiraceae bacterium]